MTQLHTNLAPSVSISTQPSMNILKDATKYPEPPGKPAIKLYHVWGGILHQDSH